MSTFEKAPEVKRIAEELIDQHHPHLQDHARKLVDYYYRYGGGVDWGGKCKKCTAFERHVTSMMFFLFISMDAWKAMSAQQRVALVDHELCHIQRDHTEQINSETQQWERKWCNADDPDSWSIRKHDVEEFSDVIYRHGLWETGIEKIAAAVRKADQQLTIEDMGMPGLRKVSGE